MSELAAELGALLVVDAVTSAGATPVEMDARGIDALFTCTQKGLGCPSGLAPLSMSARAVEVMKARRSPVPSFALDLGLHAGYQAESPVYHHTSPSGSQLALHEALRLIHEEGLAARYQRHAEASARAVAGLETLGLELLVPKEQRIPHLLAVRVPEGVDDAKVRRHLLERHSIEIGGGLGQLKGKIWRMGLMAEGARPRSVDKLLEGLKEALKSS
jgi:alanine-glyoxylate transaminase/serine-glyoxylate transaminase/serine-pyruvate transaminase